MSRVVLASLVILVVLVILPFTIPQAKALELQDIVNLFKNNQIQNKNSESLLEQTKLGQEKFHQPTVNGEEITTSPYLVLPFSKEDTQNGSITISEGWLYSFGEYSIHGMEVHAAVDFSAPYGTTVYAPADGYTMSSYHNLFAKDKNQEVITREGKPIKYGLGLFIRMYIPQNNRFLDLAHLSEIDPAIPFSEPEFDEVERIWQPTKQTVLIQDIPTHSQWVKVKKGQILGKVGTSGLCWGYEDFLRKPDRKITFNPAVNMSWDEPHLHLEEFSQIENPINLEREGQKVAPRDIFGIYSYNIDYPKLNEKLNQNLKPLILTNTDGTPLFAR